MGCSYGATWELKGAKRFATQTGGNAATLDAQVAPKDAPLNRCEGTLCCGRVATMRRAAPLVPSYCVADRWGEEKREMGGEGITNTSSCECL